MKKNFISLLLCMLAVIVSTAQQGGTRKPDTKYGKDGFKTEKTVTKDGKKIETTEYYEVKMIDGKRIELKRESIEGTEDLTTKEATEIRKEFEKDGVTEKKISEIRYSGNNERVFHEEKEFGMGKRVIKASKHELGFDGIWREFEFDYQKQEYKPVPREIDAAKFRRVNFDASNCPVSSNIFAGYTFLNRDYGDERISSHGVNGSATVRFNFKNINVPLGIRISATTATHRSGIAKIGFQTFRAGPVVTFNNNCDLMPSIFLQAGIASDSYKFENVKSSGSSFAASAGGSLDWFFTEDIGLRLSSEALLSRFNKQSQWHFIGSTGIVYKIGRKSK